MQVVKPLEFAELYLAYAAAGMTMYLISFHVYVAVCSKFIFV